MFAKCLTQQNLRRTEITCTSEIGFCPYTFIQILDCAVKMADFDIILLVMVYLVVIAQMVKGNWECVSNIEKCKISIRKWLSFYLVSVDCPRKLTNSYTTQPDNIPLETDLKIFSLNVFSYGFARSYVLWWFSWCIIDEQGWVSRQIRLFWRSKSFLAFERRGKRRRHRLVWFSAANNPSDLTFLSTEKPGFWGGQEADAHPIPDGGDQC